MCVSTLLGSRQCVAIPKPGQSRPLARVVGCRPQGQGGGALALELMRCNHCTPGIGAFQGLRLLSCQLQMKAETLVVIVHFQRLSRISIKNAPRIFTNAVRSVSKNLTEYHLGCLMEGNPSKFKVSVTVMEMGPSEREIKSNKSMENLEKSLPVLNENHRKCI